MVDFSLFGYNVLLAQHRQVNLMIVNVNVVQKQYHTLH